MIRFRTLKADEVEVRPQSIKNGKANMLLYIDSRCVTNLLDETVGCFNWQSEFYEVNGQTIGKLGIWDAEKEQWIWKSDIGAESNIEAEKGLISDTYKRLLSRWGVCELYSSPKIQIEDDGYGNTGYKVTEIEYDENRKITHLVIANRFNKEVFRWNKGTVEQPTQYKPKGYTQTTQSNLEWEETAKDNLTLLKEFYEQNKRNPNVNVEQLTKFKDYYKGRTSDWKGEFNPTLMFERWMQRAA